MQLTHWKTAVQKAVHLHQKGNTMTIFKTAILLLVGLFVIRVSLTLLDADKHLLTWRERIEDFCMYTLMQCILAAPLLYFLFALLNWLSAKW